MPTCGWYEREETIGFVDGYVCMARDFFLFNYCGRYSKCHYYYPVFLPTQLCAQSGSSTRQEERNDWLSAALCGSAV